MNILEKIKKAVEDFRKIQDKYKDFGTRDTEPDGVFHYTVKRSWFSESFTFPVTSKDWEIFSNKNHSDAVAKKLSVATQNVIDLLGEVKNKDRKPVDDYLKNYCWRTGWYNWDN